MSSNKINGHRGYEGFYRSSDEKIILGVCRGLSHKYGLQIGLVRFLTFVSGFLFIGWIYFGGFFIPKLPTKGV
jgi:phage shock protein PspC (stress-responsive transcriptional regulator)